MSDNQGSRWSGKGVMQQVRIQIQAMSEVEWSFSTDQLGA